MQNAKVSSLKNMENNGWDNDIICDLSDERDREQIKFVQFSRRVREDSWMWKFEI